MSMLRADKINVNTLRSLISTMAIPFIDFGHTTYIPDEMKRHMNKDVMQALTPSVRSSYFLSSACTNLEI